MGEAPAWPGVVVVLWLMGVAPAWAGVVVFTMTGIGTVTVAVSVSLTVVGAGTTPALVGDVGMIVTGTVIVTVITV